jgi:Domain of unknown function (DUF4933)
MKRLIIPSFFGLMLLFILSCHNNRLKTNEKELVSEIVLQENEKLADEKAAFEKKISETDNKSSGGLRLKENRSIDPQRPPIRIDIPGTKENERNFKLSDIASSVRYVKLQNPPDTILTYDPAYSRTSLISSIKVADGQIIFQGLFGITRFNMLGEYKETIWKNERGIKMDGQGVRWYPASFFGVMPNNPVSVLNGNIFYTFTDGNTGTGQYMRYKPESTIDISIQSQKEVPGLGSARGDTLSISRMQPMDRFDWIYGISSDTWAGINSKWNAGKTGSLLVTYNSIGDTICQFTDFDRIVNFNQSTSRHPIDFTNYYYEGLLTIKQEYNDTVFRLIPPDRLLPTYIIDFGESKVDYMEGLDPNSDISEKFMLNSMFETSDFILIRYTQNYASPNNLKKNSVKFYNVLFDKKQMKLYHQTGFSKEPEGIINDIDGGMPFWPDYITPQGEMIKLVSGKMIKDYINSAKFRESTISEENRKKQKSVGDELKPSDMVLVFVK